MEKKIRTCKARGCTALFTPKVKTQTYCSRKCQLRENDRKFRERNAKARKIARMA